MKTSVLLSEFIPRDQAWFLPDILARPLPGESINGWAERLLQAAKEGKVCIIKGLGDPLPPDQP